MATRVGSSYNSLPSSLSVVMHFFFYVLKFPDSKNFSETENWHFENQIFFLLFFGVVVA